MWFQMPSCLGKVSQQPTSTNTCWPPTTRLAAPDCKCISHSYPQRLLEATASAASHAVLESQPVLPLASRAFDTRSRRPASTRLSDLSVPSDFLLAIPCVGMFMLIAYKGNVAKRSLPSHTAKLIETMAPVITCGIAAPWWHAKCSYQLSPSASSHSLDHGEPIRKRGRLTYTLPCGGKTAS